MPHEITLAEPVRVRCRGRVRRTKIEAMDRVGVVVDIQRYQFLREKEEKLAPRFRITSDMRESLTSSSGRRIGQ